MHPRKTIRILAAMAISAVATATAQSDDPFLRSLARDRPVDRPGLARFVAAVSSTLDNGLDSAEYLKLIAEDAVRGEQFRVKAAEEMQRRLDAYDSALAEFRAASRLLVLDPSSDSALFTALTAGQHSCWRLESHMDLAESYGAKAGTLRGLLASGNACAEFSHVAFQPKVVGLIRQALLEERDEPKLSRENRVLKEELAALEQLLEDLREIDAD